MNANSEATFCIKCDLVSVCQMKWIAFFWILDWYRTARSLWSPTIIMINDKMVCGQKDSHAIACLMRECSAIRWNIATHEARTSLLSSGSHPKSRHGTVSTRMSQTVAACLLHCSFWQGIIFSATNEHVAFVLLVRTRLFFIPFRKSRITNKIADIFSYIKMIRWTFGLPVVIWFAINTSITWEAWRFAFE